MCMLSVPGGDIFQLVNGNMASRVVACSGNADAELARPNDQRTRNEHRRCRTNPGVLRNPAGGCHFSSVFFGAFMLTDMFSIYRCSKSYTGYRFWLSVLILQEVILMILLGLYVRIGADSLLF